MFQQVRDRVAALYTMIEDLTYREQQALMVALGGVAVVCLVFYKVIAAIALVVGVLAGAGAVYMFFAVCEWEEIPENESEGEQDAA
jgi:hypothetical protein